MFELVVGNISLLHRFLSHFRHCFSKSLFFAISIYVNGLLLSMDRHSISAIAARSPVISFENLQYSLSDAKWDSDELNSSRLELLQSCRPTRATTRGCLIVDDTGARKSKRVKDTDGAKYQHFPTTGKEDFCNIFVFTAWANSTKCFPVVQQPYIPEDAIFHDSARFVFKDKHQLGRENIQYAIHHHIPFDDILFDNWYLSEKTVRFIESRCLTFVSELACDSKVLFGQKWVRADELVKLIPSTEFRKVTLSSNVAGEPPKEFSVAPLTTRVHFLGKNKYKLAVVMGTWDEQDEKNVHVYITNHHSLSVQQILERRQLRSKIERLFEELKQCAALDQFQLRHARDIARHCNVALLAHSYLYWALCHGHLSHEADEPPKSVFAVLEIHRGLNSRLCFEWITANLQTYKQFLRKSRLSKSKFSTNSRRKAA